MESINISTSLVEDDNEHYSDSQDMATDVQNMESMCMNGESLLELSDTDDDRECDVQQCYFASNGAVFQPGIRMFWCTKCRTECYSLDVCQPCVDSGGHKHHRDYLKESD